MKVFCFEIFGDVNVLYYKEIYDLIISLNEIFVCMKVIGLNFVDIYRCCGDYYFVGNLFYVLGYEGVGIVEKVGVDVIIINLGDCIVFVDVLFVNVELVVVLFEKVILLLDFIFFEIVVFVLL